MSRGIKKVPWVAFGAFGSGGTALAEGRTIAAWERGGHNLDERRVVPFSDGGAIRLAL